MVRIENFACKTRKKTEMSTSTVDSHSTESTNKRGKNPNYKGSKLSLFANDIETHRKP